MTRLILAVIAVALLVTAPAHAQQTIAGRYAVEGSNPDGSTYKGQVEIAAQGDVWNLQWTFGQGGSIGVGLLDGGGTILSVIFQTSEGTIGLASYRVERNGPSVRLIGRWTVPGDPMAHVLTETFTQASIRAAAG